MKKSLKIIFYLVLPIITLFVLVYLNLGYCLDITQKPEQSDIIICLGGGKQERIEKSIELYRQGYAEKNVMLLIGSNSQYIAYAKKFAPDIQYIEHHQPINTAEEIFYIKHFMKTHEYNSAIIVSEPAHSRRVMMLSRLISVDGDDNFLFIPVNSGVKWWNRQNYFLNRQAVSMALLEIIKIPNSYYIYGILGRLNS